MYKIRHIATQRFVSHWGSRTIFYAVYKDVPSVKYTTVKGRHWAMTYAVQKCFDCLEHRFPGEFEIVEYKIAERLEVK